MSWIKIITYDEADGLLKRLYNRIKGPNNTIDNVLSMHSLRPQTLNGHMTLYKAVLHHNGNTLPKWYLESLGVYVSHLNGCDYCIAHHFQGLKRLLKDDAHANALLDAVQGDLITDFFDDKLNAGMVYAKLITHEAHRTSKADIDTLKNVGFTDGEILEINQVVSYFNYVNRSVLGLGVTTQGDILGLSPNNNDDPEHWGHT